MKIRLIETKRSFNDWRSWQLVYEWEDVFRSQMKAPFICHFDVRLRRFKKLYRLFPISKLWRIPTFEFEMLTYQRFLQHNNNPYVVPCIIDWYLKTEEELEEFFKRYSKHKIILVTSMQVYKYLQSIPTAVPFGHFPLSLSDKYRITPETVFSKDLDVVLMGRQNPVLLGWLNRYKKEYPSLVIVSSQREKDNYDYYTEEGRFVANATSREQCMALMRRSRVSLYSTKGMDNDFTAMNTNGFSQVTPRIFECLATGNHVIARYLRNEDTDYFELDTICPHTDSYESFVKQMDYALTHPVDMKKYSNYLEKHYTSNRVKMLMELVKPL